jgi:hypothetical protein
MVDKVGFLEWLGYKRKKVVKHVVSQPFYYLKLTNKPPAI